VYLHRKALRDAQMLLRIGQLVMPHVSRACCINVNAFCKYVLQSVYICPHITIGLMAPSEKSGFQAKLVFVSVNFTKRA
jgi:hypothetical protein